MPRRSRKLTTSSPSSTIPIKIPIRSRRSCLLKLQMPMRKVEEDLSNELELQIQGAEKPSMWNLFAVQFLLLPYALGKMLFWRSCWFWRYHIKKASYTCNDACYLTRSCLKVPLEAWENIDEQMKDDRVLKCLWIKSNMENYLAEMRKESKRRRWH